MPTIQFPNVPDLPGVPAIPRSAAFPPAAQAALGLVQGALWRALRIDRRWGIFDAHGKPLADPAHFQGLAGVLLGTLGTFGSSTVSTGGVDYAKETRVSDFPVEQGGFASYNKAEMPAAPLVTLCMSGSESDRTKFLDAIDKACKSTDLYSVATPEVTYIGYTIESYRYSRHSARGATLMTVEISLKEVRQVSAQFAKVAAIVAPKATSAAPKVDAGNVQAPKPDVSTLKGLVNKAPGLLNTITGLLGG